MQLKRILIPLFLLGLALAAIWYFTQSTETNQVKDINTNVKSGEFKIFVNATGELQAKNSVKILGPQGMRSAQIFETSILDMVPEGTLVEEGEFVANLDRTELETKMNEAQNEVDKILKQLEQAKIDTAIELRGIRDQLINLKFSMEEKKLQVEQSQFEPRSVIRQAEIDLERAERDYNQLKKKYELTQAKSRAQISEIMANLRQFESKRERLVDLSKEFRVTAPDDGMVIYARSWDGKVGPGSRIRAWDPTVAELPDLSDMVSKSYVNEVDISKVQKGQDVKLKVDAFPDREYTGTVIQIANIGEQLRGYDAKVFEVVVQVNEVDSILRPAMTTSNEILTHVFEDVLYIPLEALQSDSISYVFLDDNGTVVKKEIIPGETNDNEVIVAHGLEAGDNVLLTVPENEETLEVRLLDPEIKKQIAEKLEKQKAEREKLSKEKAKKVKDENIPTQSRKENRVIIF